MGWHSEYRVLRSLDYQKSQMENNIFDPIEYFGCINVEFYDFMQNEHMAFHPKDFQQPIDIVRCRCTFHDCKLDFNESFSDEDSDEDSHLVARNMPLQMSDKKREEYTNNIITPRESEGSKDYNRQNTIPEAFNEEESFVAEDRIRVAPIDNSFLLKKFDEQVGNLDYPIIKETKSSHCEPEKDLLNFDDSAFVLSNTTYDEIDP